MIFENVPNVAKLVCPSVVVGVFTLTPALFRKIAKKKINKQTNIIKNDKYFRIAQSRKFHHGPQVKHLCNVSAVVLVRRIGAHYIVRCRHKSAAASSADRPHLSHGHTGRRLLTGYVIRPRPFPVIFQRTQVWQRCGHYVSV